MCQVGLQVALEWSSRLVAVWTMEQMPAMSTMIIISFLSKMNMVKKILIRVILYLLGNKQWIEYCFKMVPEEARQQVKGIDTLKIMKLNQNNLRAAPMNLSQLSAQQTIYSLGHLPTPYKIASVPWIQTCRMKKMRDSCRSMRLTFDNIFPLSNNFKFILIL